MAYLLSIYRGALEMGFFYLLKQFFDISTNFNHSKALRQAQCDIVQGDRLKIAMDIKMKEDLFIRFFGRKLPLNDKEMLKQVQHDKVLAIDPETTLRQAQSDIVQDGRLKIVTDI